MRSRRATTCSTTCSAPASTAAGGRRAIDVARAHRARDADRRLHGHGRRGARSARAARGGATGGSRRRRGFRRSDAGARRRQGAGGGGVGRIVLVHGDAMRLPVADGDRPTPSRSPSASATCRRPDVACAEMARVLRPGGRLAILEFGVPRVPGISGALPVVLHGRAAADRAADLGPHRRLFVSAGVGRHLPAAGGVREHAASRRDSTDVRADPLTFGIVYLYTARRA